MRLFSRYLLGKFIAVLLITLLGAMLIFMVIDFVENTTDWLNRPSQDAINYYINYAPHIFYLTLPIALLLASVFSVGNCARHLELAAMRCAGASPYRILFPLLFFAAIISLGTYYFNDLVLPDANHRRFSIKEPQTKENEDDNPHERSKFVYIGPERTTYFIQYYSGLSKSGQGVTLLQDENGDLVQRYDAATIRWENHWILENGTHRTFKNQEVSTEKFSRLDMKNLTDRPEDLVNTRIYPDEMRIKELDYRIDILKRSGESTSRFETQRNFKESGALVNFIMVVIGASIAFGTGRTGVTKQIGLSLLVAFSYFFLIRLGLTLGENGGLSPKDGAWLGNYVFGGLSLILFYRTGRR